MKLYHGSENGNIEELKPFVSNHNNAYVYLTDNIALATLYSYNILPRPGGFFTYHFDKDGNTYYDEYFENQTEIIYKNKSGYIYIVENNNLTQLDKMPWVYLSDKPIKFEQKKYIPDIYEELLKLESMGKLKINRFKDIPNETKEKHYDVIRKDILDKDLINRPDNEYSIFLRKYLPHLFVNNNK